MHTRLPIAKERIVLEPRLEVGGSFLGCFDEIVVMLEEWIV